MYLYFTWIVHFILLFTTFHRGTFSYCTFTKLYQTIKIIVTHQWLSDSDCVPTAAHWLWCVCLWRPSVESCCNCIMLSTELPVFLHCHQDLFSLRTTSPIWTWRCDVNQRWRFTMDPSCEGVRADYINSSSVTSVRFLERPTEIIITLYCWTLLPWQQQHTDAAASSSFDKLYYMFKNKIVCLLLLFLSCCIKGLKLSFVAVTMTHKWTSVKTQDDEAGSINTHSAHHGWCCTWNDTVSGEVTQRAGIKNQIFVSVKWIYDTYDTRFTQL